MAKQGDYTEAQKVKVQGDGLEATEVERARQEREQQALGTEGKLLHRSTLKAPPPLAAPQLGSCASSGRAWRLWAARHSQEEAQPLGAQPLPRVLEPTASQAADPTSF